MAPVARLRPPQSCGLCTWPPEGAEAEEQVADTRLHALRLAEAKGNAAIITLLGGDPNAKMRNAAD